MSAIYRLMLIPVLRPCSIQPVALCATYVPVILSAVCRCCVACMSQGTVQTRPLKIFSKRGVCKIHLVEMCIHMNATRGFFKRYALYKSTFYLPYLLTKIE